MLIVDDVQWTEEADIVVVGFGSAGAVSAITAHDLGANVLILEKQPADSHMSTSHMSGSIFISPKDVSAATAYMEALARDYGGLYWTDRDVIRTWVEYSSQNRQWMEKLGAAVERHEGLLLGEYDLPGCDSMEVYHIPELGWGMMRLFKDWVQSRNIPILYDTPADKLLTNIRGEVIGVRAYREGKAIMIRASKAVIMTTGGFEFDEVMKLNYLKVYPTYFAGSPADTGDGIRMAQEVGASLWHMNCVAAQWVMKFPDFPFAFVCNFRGSRGTAEYRRDEVRGNPCGYIIVDKYGKRYTNEETKWHAVYYELTLYDCDAREYPRVPSYWIFDRKRLDGPRLPLWRHGPMESRFYKWSDDNRGEIKKGWIVEAGNIRDLAHKLEMNAAVLEKEVQKYNKYCERKEDPEFHRPAKHLVPLAEPPFCAVALWPGSFNTQGGPRRNRKGQILDPDGNPIPRLYAAGELGSVLGMLYPTGGGNLAECIAFGRISGENAVREKSIAIP